MPDPNRSVHATRYRLTARRMSGTLPDSPRWQPDPQRTARTATHAAPTATEHRMSHPSPTRGGAHPRQLEELEEPLCRPRVARQCRGIDELRRGRPAPAVAHRLEELVVCPLLLPAADPVSLWPPPMGRRCRNGCRRTWGSSLGSERKNPCGENAPPRHHLHHRSGGAMCVCAQCWVRDWES